MCAAPAAWAKQRVVVLGFTGPQASKAEVEVAKIVRRKHTLVPVRQWARARKRLGAKGSSDKTVRRVAAEVGADAIISGTITRKAGKFALRVTVREGRTGRTVQAIRVVLRSPRIDARAREDLARELLPAIARARGPGAAEVRDERADRPERRRRKAPKSPESGESSDSSASSDAAGSDGDNERAEGRGGPVDPASVEDDEPVPGVDDAPARRERRVASASGADRESGALTDDNDDDNDAAEGPRLEAAVARDSRRWIVEIGAGVSVTRRRLDFTYQSDLQNKPFGYDGRPVAGGVVAGEIYPLASRRGFVGGLGVGFAYDRVFLLKSRLETGGDEYDTTQIHWGVGARWRWNPGSRPTLPTVKLGVGFGRLTFAIDTNGTALDLPDIDYQYLDAGLGVRVPLGANRFALVADGKYLFVMGSGDFETMENYGSGSIQGLDAQAGVEWRALPFLTVRVAGRYVRLAHAFDGSGAKASMRDADQDKDVGGALDQYMGGYVTAGTRF